MSKGRTNIAREAWKPSCREHVEGLMDAFRIRADRCQRKQNHRGRCVGNFLVWDKNKITQLRRALQP